jgi:hypothetical protein
VIPASPGAPVASLAPYGGNVSYGFGYHAGRAVLSLQVARPRFLPGAGHQRAGHQRRRAAFTAAARTVAAAAVSHGP